MLLIKNFLTSYAQNLFNILTYSIHIIISLCMKQMTL